MARARRVRGIRPRWSLRQNAVLVVETRLQEFLFWRDALDDEQAVTQLHDMRIAAKRLRYALEMFEICFPEAKRLLKDLTKVQEDLGDIHDLDVLGEILRSRLRLLEAPLLDQAIESARTAETRGQHINQLRQLIHGQARDPIRLGLLALIGDKVLERHERFEAFRRRWGQGQLDAFAGRVRQALVAQDATGDSGTTSDQGPEA